MSFLQQLKLKNPNVRGAAKNIVSRVQRQTLEQARDAVLKKLEANKAYFIDKTNPRPDLCYKLTAVGYVMGIKYGNRYLTNVFIDDDGTGGDLYLTYLMGMSDEDMPFTFDFAISLVKRGGCDEAIKKAQAANIAIHAKR